MLLWSLLQLNPLREKHGRMEMLENRVLRGTSGLVSGRHMRMKKHYN